MMAAPRWCSGRSAFFGRRPTGCRFNTLDHSRNNWFLALLTFGEGWRNSIIFRWPFVVGDFARGKWILPIKC